MGQQSNKIEKRRRRKAYLERCREKIRAAIAQAKCVEQAERRAKRLWQARGNTARAELSMDRASTRMGPSSSSESKRELLVTRCFLTGRPRRIEARAVGNPVAFSREFPVRSGAGA